MLADMSVGQVLKRYTRGPSEVFAARAGGAANSSTGLHAGGDAVRLTDAVPHTR